MKTSGNMLRGRAALFGCSAVSLAMAIAIAPPARAQADASAEEETQAIVVTGSRIVRRDVDSDSPLVTVASERLENSSDTSIERQLSALPQFVSNTNQITTATSVQATPTQTPGIATANLRGVGENRTLVLLDGRRTQPANASLVVDLNIIPRAAIDGVEIITGGAGATYGADAVAGVVNFKLKRNFSGLDLDVQHGVSARGDGQETRIAALIGSDFADGNGNAMFGISHSRRSAVQQGDRRFYTEAWTDPNTAGTGTFVYFPAYQPAHTANGATFFSYGPASNLPSQAAVNTVFQSYGLSAGDVARNALLYFNPSTSIGDASLFSAARGATSGTSAPNFKGTLYPENKILANGSLTSNNALGYLSSPMTRYSMFGHAYYDVSDGLTFYLQGLFDQNETITQTAYAPAVNQWGVGIPYDSATCGATAGHQVPTALCAILNSRPSPDSPWELNRVMTFMGPEQLLTTSNTYEVLAGLRGDIGIKDWTFDLFASHGRTSQTVRYRGFVDLEQYQRLIEKPNWGAGATFFNPRIGQNATCTSGLNPFSNAPVSQNCIDIITAAAKTYSDLRQDQAELTVQGGLIDLPAGELRFAAGAGYRKNAFSYEPDSAFSSNNIDSLVVGIFSTLPAGGSFTVKEFFGEVLVPVVSDLPLIQELTLNAGYRHSDYSTSGGVSTWKVTGDWEVTDWLKIRGGYQRANRAPNVAELFQPGTYLTVSWTDHDPCSNLTRATWGNNAANTTTRSQVLGLCNAIAGTQTAGPGGTPLIDTNYVGNQPVYFNLGRDFVVGNPNVKSEEATTWTVGTVITAPPALGIGRLSLSVDWYNIKVEGAIQPASTQFVYQQCFNADGSSNASYDPNNEYCKLIVRSNSTGFWLSTNAQYQNLGLIQTAGLDVALDWSIPAPGFGDQGAVNLNMSFNYLDKYLVQGVPGGTVIDYADTLANSITGAPYGAQFRWKLNTMVGYNFGPGSISLSWRHLPKARHSAAATNPATTTQGAPAYDLFGLSGRVNITDMLEIRGGVDNLFDKQPPRVGVISGTTAAAGQTDTTAYDVLGRRFYVGAKLRF